MVALQIRNVPEDVRDALVRRAEQRGQSLQAYLLALVQDDVRRHPNLELLDRLAARPNRSRVTAEDTVRAIAEARAERDRHLFEAVGLDPELADEHLR